MNSLHTVLAALALLPTTVAPRTQSAAETAFRPPAVPLVACDPYFSIWSEATRLTDDATRHWTRAKHELCSLIRIDGKTYRLMGDQPKDVPPMEQESVQVLPTRSIYEFKSPEADVVLTFMTPVLPDDLDVLSRPLTYVKWNVHAIDGKAHHVQIFFSASGELAVNTMDEALTWSRETAGDMQAMRIGTEAQPILGQSGDDMRIDWGYAYLASPEAEATSIAPQSDCIEQFTTSGGLPPDDTRMPRPARDSTPAMALTLDLVSVAEQTMTT